MNTKKKAALTAMCVVLGGLCFIVALALGILYNPLIGIGAIALAPIIHMAYDIYENYE